MKILITSIICFISLNSFAQLKGEISFLFRGQEREVFSLEKTVIETRYKTEIQDTTCTRQVPYVNNECRNETRYREVCSWVPSRESCSSRTESRCRSVTRYRTECRPGPSRPVCTPQPTGPDICRDERGPDVCREVAYQDEECDTISVPYCETISGYNDCDDVAYQERVCEDITRYRSETYACRAPVQVPYQVKVPVLANVEINFIKTNFNKQIELKSNIAANKDILLNLVAANNTSDILFGIKKSQKVTPQSNSENITIDQKFSVLFYDLNTYKKELTSSLVEAKLDLTNKKILFVLTGLINPNDKIKIYIEGKRKRLIGTKTNSIEMSGLAKELPIEGIQLKDGKFQVTADLSKLNTDVLTDKKTFKLFFEHFKNLDSQFQWQGPIPNELNNKDLQLPITLL